jgi:MFS family permease
MRTAEPQAGDIAAGSSPTAVTGGRPHAGRILAIARLGVFVVILDTRIVEIAFPAIGQSFHATTGRLSWVLNAYSLVFAAALGLAGGLVLLAGPMRNPLR